MCGCARDAGAQLAMCAARENPLHPGGDRPRASVSIGPSVRLSTFPETSPAAWRPPHPLLTSRSLPPMLSSMLRTLSPSSSSRGAASPHRNTAADSKSFIELRTAVQTSDGNDLVLLEGEGVRAVGAPPRSPLSPSAFLRRNQASAAKTLVADRFARALPTAMAQDQAAIPFNNLTDAGAVRVHQLRLLTALVKFQQDLITGGMDARQAADLSTLAFTPATWNCSDTQALYNRINTCLISSNQRVVNACLDAFRRNDPPKDEAAWRLELETASGAITQRRRSLPPPPEPAPATSSEPSPLPRPDPGADPDPEDLQARRRPGDDSKSSRRASDSDWVDASEPRRADGKALPPSVNRSLAEAFSGDVSPFPTTALATRGAHPNLASTAALSLADQLSLIPMYGSPSAASAAVGRPAHLPGSQWTEAERARLADTKGHLLGLSSPERPTQLTGLRDWGRRARWRSPLQGRDPTRRVGKPRRKRTHKLNNKRQFGLAGTGIGYPHSRGCTSASPAASRQPLSDRFRDELLRWPLPVRASLLRCSADSLQSMDPRGAGWAPRYRFHAELARALAPGECYTAQEQQLQARVLGAVQAQAPESQSSRISRLWLRPFEPSSARPRRAAEVRTRVSRPLSFAWTA
jgi:hypothetical protein